LRIKFPFQKIGCLIDAIGSFKVPKFSEQAEVARAIPAFFSFAPQKKTQRQHKRERFVPAREANKPMFICFSVSSNSGLDAILSL
jgi:hypothetical protein